MHKIIRPLSLLIWREAAVRHILYLEQRARTWIIKLSCELITPSKRPGCFQEARNRLRKMTLISSFCQWNLFHFLETDGPEPGWNGYSLRFNHFRPSKPHVITMLSLFDGKYRQWMDFAPVQTIRFSVPRGLNRMFWLLTYLLTYQLECRCWKISSTVTVYMISQQYSGEHCKPLCFLEEQPYLVLNIRRSEKK